MNKRLLLILIVIISAWQVRAASTEQFEEVLEQIRLLNSQQGRNNDYLIALINRAIAQYPYEADLYMERADFYHQKKEYQLELSDYLEAQALLYDNQSYLFKNMASVYSLLGDNEKALYYGKRVVELSSMDEEALAQLLWFYLKNFKLEEGADEGFKALTLFPGSMMINSMMALIYMGLYDYEQARYFFTEAISLALRAGQLELASMNLYNQYLLEMNFYEYAEAEQVLTKALSLTENSSNYRILGELYSNKLDYSSAIAALKKSEELEFYESQYGSNERTPLSRLAMAELELLHGHFDLAKEALDESSKIASVSWMINFGINQNIHLSNLYAGYYQLWNLRLYQLKHQIAYSWWQVVNFKTQSLFARFYRFYYSNLARYYAMRSGKELYLANNRLSSYQYYQAATVGYINQQQYFISQAQLIEQAFTPRAEKHYRVLKASVTSDAAALLQSYNEFDSIYEKSAKQGALTNLILMSHGSAKRLYIEELYRLNSSAVQAYGLPVMLKIDGQPKELRQLKKYLLQAVRHDKKSSFTLEIKQEEQLILNFYDNDRLVFTEKYDYNSSKLDFFNLANLMIERLYSDY